MFWRRKAPDARRRPVEPPEPPAKDTVAHAPGTELPGSARTPESGEKDRGDLLRSIVVAVGNVGVLTALLVYFGWVRSEVQARELGIDESLLGMTTQEYVLRSVRAVLVLLIVMAVFGVLWVALDRWLSVRLRRRGVKDPVYRWFTRLLPLSVVLLPVLGWLARWWWPTAAYIGFPLLAAAGLLLMLYAFHLRGALPGAIPLAAGTESILRVSTAALIAVALFTAATNYAMVEGTQLARGLESRVRTLPGVVIHSVEPLNLDAPGVETAEAEGETGYRFRYSGLRLLERSGGRYFLITEDWTRRFGVVLVLNDDESGVRYDFIRDRRSVSPAAGRSLMRGATHD
ncbi:hypothetical protein ACFFGH_10065 [Lysobacter korlensis]|uniref:DUF5671 domain-containing protein n=1 Tax=Lysobacter korlensis TaxID=553636 RepID=A0ABV6RMH5_9GAMM